MPSRQGARLVRLQSEEIDVLTKKKFETIVETTVRFTRLSYLDAIIYICEENELEVVDIAKYISPVIKNKLEAEARSLNFLPRQSQLPI